jgi:hypothetical protein
VRQPIPFGKYLLLDRISVGGMAEVFKAKSYGVEGFEKVIAIKRILPSMGEDRDFIKMFIDEAKIAGQLTHANICQIFELGRIDGAHFIAMEYIWGKDLLQIQNRFRKRKEVMPVPMACYVISRVCEGLDYAHRKRDPMGRPLEIVHRDCSPQNVLCSYEGEVKIIDFGIAKAASRSSQTMAGVLKGKFGYMSPEQVRGLPLDRRSDIFALGTILYESLTGVRLFQGESDFSTLEKVRNVDIVPPRTVNRDIPEQVEHIVMRALERDPDDRYQGCNEMQADLRAFLMSQEMVSGPKQLSGWLKDGFAPELARERQLMEDYRRAGRDGLFQGKAAAEANLDVVEHLGEAGPVEGDPTVLGGPSFDDIIEGDVEPIRTSGRQRGDDFGDEGPTELFGEMDGRVNPASEPSEVIDESDLLEVADEDDRAKVLVSADDAPADDAPAAGGPAALAHVVFTPSGLSALTPTGDGFFGSTSSVTPLPSPNVTAPVRKGERPSIVKDIAIGVGIAVLVLGLFVGGKYLFFGDKPGTRVAEAGVTGTIAVHVPDGDPADVWVNERKAGVVAGGDTLTIDSLATGEYRVRVTRDQRDGCDRTVTLEARKVEVISCSFPAPEPVALVAPADAGVPDAAADQALATIDDDDDRDRRPVPRADRDDDDDSTPSFSDRVRVASSDTRAAGLSKDSRAGGSPSKADSEPEAKADQPEVGYFLAYTTPWARVHIDGKDTGKMTPIAPRAKIALKPGKHKVTFIVGRDEFHYWITVEPGKDVKLVEDLPVASN